MRKVLVGVGLAAVLAVVGCSSGSSSSSSSGSSGSGTSSTGGSGSSSGSSGSTGSVQGSTDTDCGFAHEACWPGESCEDFATAYNLPGRVYACACYGADSDQNSCAGNVTAETGYRNACPGTTYRCTAPRSQELALPTGDGGFACGDGLRPFIVGSFPDGGDEAVCFQPCATSAECHSNLAACFHDIPLGDGTTVDLCVDNSCGLFDVPLLDDAGNPELGPDGGGLTVTRTYGVPDGPCDITGLYPDDGGGDFSGVCVPYGGSQGYCVRGGPRQTGQPCTNDRSGTGDVVDSCVGGDLCFGPEANAPNVEVDGVLYGSFTCHPACNPGPGYADGGAVIHCPTDAGTPTCEELGSYTGPVEPGACTP